MGVTTIVKLWQVATGRRINTLQGHTGPVWSVAYAPSAGYVNSPNDQTLTSASDDHSMKLWQVSTGECLKTLQGHVDTV